MVETLRQIAGLPKTPAPLSESVILIVDAQKEYTVGRLPLDGIDSSVLALAKFIETAREKGVPIIHIVHHALASSEVFATGSKTAEIIDELAPLVNEEVVVKSFPSSFTGTTLREHLDNLGRTNLLVCGYMTHMCVSSTVRAATESGYNCTIVEEFTATRDLPGVGGGVIEAKVLKAAILAAMSDRFALVVKSASDLVW